MKKKYSVIEKKKIERGIVLSDFQKLSFSKQLKKYFDGKMPSGEMFYLGITPKLLVRNGANNFKLVMKQETLDKIIRSPEENMQGHHINKKIINKLYKNICSPMMIIRGSIPNTLVEILFVKDDNKRNILLSFSLNSKEYEYEVTRITSAYGKKRICSYLTNISREILFISDKKKMNNWLLSEGLQLSKHVTNDSSYKYIICIKYKKSNK